MLHLPRSWGGPGSARKSENSSDSGSRNADTSPPRSGVGFCWFVWVFFLLLSYKPPLGRATRGLLNPAGGDPSVEPSNQIPPERFLMRESEARSFPGGHLLAGRIRLPVLAQQQPGFSLLEALRDCGTHTGRAGGAPSAPPGLGMGAGGVSPFPRGVSQAGSE